LLTLPLIFGETATPVLTAQQRLSSNGPLGSVTILADIIDMVTETRNR